MLDKLKKENKELTKESLVLCELILDNNKANSGALRQNAVNVFDILHYTKEEYAEQISKQNRIVKQLSEEINRINNENESLKTQIFRYLQEGHSPTQQSSASEALKDKASDASSHALAVADKDLEIKETLNISATQKENTNKEQQHGDPFNRKPKQWHASASSQVEIEDVESEEEMEMPKYKGKQIIPHIVDIKSYFDNIDAQMWDILIAIGKDGHSELKCIEEARSVDIKNKTSLNSNIQQLQKMGLIEKDKITMGWRWTYCYNLSNIGKRVFAERFKTDPVKSEKEKLQAEHTSITHGYCIKDAANLLMKMHGFENPVISRENNKITVPDMGIYIPDIKALNPKDGKTDYFEVERGTCSQEDFNKKCEKMRQITNRLYFITPDEKSANIVEKQVARYMLNKGSKLQGVMFFITTMNKLSEGMWGKKLTI